jgi:hypothetical protein
VPRLSADQWETIRAEREATGASFGDLSAKHGVDRGAIWRKSQKEGWGDGSDVADVVRNKVNAKVNGVDYTADPKKRAEAIDAAADRVVAVVERHRTEWNVVGDLQAEAMSARFASPDAAFTRAKFAKIYAETLAIKQTNERKAHGLERDPADMKVTVAKAVDYTKLADSTLEDIARAANPSAT